MSNEHVLSVKNLSIEYKADRGQVHAVTDVSFHIRRGEFFGLAGESGCGKSTVAFSIMQLLKGAATIPQGEINFNGKNVLMFQPEELRLFRWEKTSMVLQSAMNNLNPVVTIKSQLADAILAHEKVTKPELEARLKELVAMVNINADRLNAYPHELSGGMRQRVVIAMALALRPDLIIFDEPTTALDVVVQYNIIRKITELKEKMGFSIMFITHDLPLMLEMCDRIGIMYAGRMMEVSPVENLLHHAAHPYTRGLLKAFPSLLGEKVRLTGIPGSVPDLITPPEGCLFYERCAEKCDKCRQEQPEFKEIGAHWFCACHNAEKEVSGKGAQKA
ncbi:ABC transporter ATP-binding protein [Ruminococcus gauvreauii]|uniref:ABC transporter ATP-binding protein n=1 Tax=Ruminococcus gauvreauii TaxID=438033 RepID=A0ABY5VJS1_9FIRM|nr:ABC transporter ATP-binding protein [Ruminococcus gauvreauii]UWP60804.1 ABC transporter ATP-binding protein [Ruminococcus gauvreauii]